MKPIILYALPRSRSTAVLYSCKSKIKLNEPFGLTHIHENKTQSDSWLYRSELNTNFINSGQWDNIIDTMNCNDTVTKVLSSDLYNFPPSRTWFENSIENQTHEVFIVEREDREESLISYIIAGYFGWHKSTQVDPYKFTAKINILPQLNSLVDSYLRFYPKRGRIITFNNLPENHFDKKLNHTENQESVSKYEYFENIDEFRIHIKYILDLYKDEWDSKIRNLDQFDL
jgi:hypothetical protein